MALLLALLCGLTMANYMDCVNVKEDGACTAYPRNYKSFNHESTNNFQYNLGKFSKPVPTPLGDICGPSQKKQLPISSIPKLKENEKKDDQQEVLFGHPLTTKAFANCSTSVDSAKCTACYKLPYNIEHGLYTLQWFWEYAPQDYYMTCADIQINKKATPKLTRVRQGFHNQPSVAFSPSLQADYDREQAAINEEQQQLNYAQQMLSAANIDPLARDAEQQRINNRRNQLQGFQNLVNDNRRMINSGLEPTYIPDPNQPLVMSKEKKSQTINSERTVSAVGGGVRTQTDEKVHTDSQKEAIDGQSAKVADSERHVMTQQDANGFQGASQKQTVASEKVANNIGAATKDTAEQEQKLVQQQGDRYMTSTQRQSLASEKAATVFGTASAKDTATQEQLKTQGDSFHRNTQTDSKKSTNERAASPYGAGERQTDTEVHAATQDSPNHQHKETIERTATRASINHGGVVHNADEVKEVNAVSNLHVSTPAFGGPRVIGMPSQELILMNNGQANNDYINTMVWGPDGRVYTRDKFDMMMEDNVEDAGLFLRCRAGDCINSDKYRSVNIYLKGSMEELSGAQVSLVHENTLRPYPLHRVTMTDSEWNLFKLNLESDVSYNGIVFSNLKSIEEGRYKVGKVILSGI
ncbi:hypothetical protein SAMD00019534_047070 [Acytostelium subglobosum LB1]|uniref:hypothetical protein n=1 Tax=Acytostelium subglobosum LB1 TaxID=1410327 RepID=UPI0006449234|nr:hypothetical protein SAMD00019534_047070 [Acytostelium subglobosum LB1]GAM21532.1 hypothetical protein SAMD00019534_047070 [Acytostelium subglobosum LB1]|eukprot:XP_012755651.1 hypothetical protein SAMD00019534_047070 [Acytostelium subglobosum LB1]